jgi:hypothetical protein
VDQAINSCGVPDGTESRIYWYIALAGNLLWAATCLLAPPTAAGAAGAKAVEAADIAALDFLSPPAPGAKPLQDLSKVAKATEAMQSRVITLMSFAGGTVASGTVEQVFPSRDIGSLAPEDGKNLVRNVVGRRRAELEKIYAEVRGEWALQLDAIGMSNSLASRQQPLELYGQYLWTQMFPRIDYNENRFTAIRDTARKKVETMLADYNRQWQKWRTDQMMPKFNQSYALWAMGTLAIVPKEFTAKLNFSTD